MRQNRIQTNTNKINLFIKIEGWDKTKEIVNIYII